MFNVSSSIGASLQERVDSLPVSTRAFYLKLNGIEPDVAAVLTRDSAQQLAPVIRKLGLRTPLLSGCCSASLAISVLSSRIAGSESLARARQ